jgi:hypothetical protein
MVTNFIKYFSIPEETGVDKALKLNTYYAFSAALMDLVTQENKCVLIRSCEGKPITKVVNESIEVEDEKGNITSAMQKINKEVYSWEAVVEVYSKTDKVVELENRKSIMLSRGKDVQNNMQPVGGD